MAIAQQTHVKTEAQNKPVLRPSQLRKWWAPDLAGYKAYKVMVLSHKTTPRRDLLEFELAGDADVKKKKRPRFTVDLNIAELCWGTIPSTAQLARKGQYGFLLLSAAWADANGVDPQAQAENGAKWPIDRAL